MKTMCECHKWCWIDQRHGEEAHHHDACPHYESTLIDVWEIRKDGSSAYCVVNTEGDARNTCKDYGNGSYISKTRMPREVFENLQEFEEFEV